MHAKTCIASTKLEYVLYAYLVFSFAGYHLCHSLKYTVVNRFVLEGAHHTLFRYLQVRNAGKNGQQCLEGATDEGTHKCVHMLSKQKG